MLSTAYHLMSKCLSSFAAARLLLARRTKPHNLHGFMATILFFNTIRNPSCTRHFFFLRISDFLFCFVLFFLRELIIVIQFATDPLYSSRWEFKTCSINGTLIWVKILANQQLKTFTVVYCIFVITFFWWLRGGEEKPLK